MHRLMDSWTHEFVDWWIREFQEVGGLYIQMPIYSPVDGDANDVAV